MGPWALVLCAHARRCFVGLSFTARLTSRCDCWNLRPGADGCHANSSQSSTARTGGGAFGSYCMSPTPTTSQIRPQVHIRIWEARSAHVGRPIGHHVDVATCRDHLTRHYRRIDDNEAMSTAAICCDYIHRMQIWTTRCTKATSPAQ